MRRRFFAALVIGCAILSSISFGATYGGGSGTSADPYQIWTLEQMNTIGANSSDWGKCFKLMADIDMSIYTGTQYNIIGDSTTQFTGTFDGNNFVISNLTYITQSKGNYAGLFGYTSNAAIKNLGVKNVTISVNSLNTGGLIGCQSGGTITNCYTTGLVDSSGFESWFSNVNTGGLVGFLYNGTITCSYCTVSVNASAPDLSYVGGLAGSMTFGSINRCYSTGKVSSFYMSGGLIGGQNSGTINNCYSTGIVTSTYTAGGLMGYQSDGLVASCFWDTQTSGRTISAGGSGVQGKTTAQMKMQSTFTGWDFVDTWYMTGYPSLKWEINPLQAQIDASINGVTITVQPGLYQGRLYFKGKNITLTSANPQDAEIVASTVIAGLGSGSVITFAGTETAACVLRGLTITGGVNLGRGGGIAGNSTHAGIFNCTIRDNVAAYGGGIDGCQGRIENCTIADNSASQNGGGLANCGGVIMNCLVESNSAANLGGGLNYCNGTIVNCTIADNKASSGGGGLNNCSGMITNCIVWNNTPIDVSVISQPTYCCSANLTGSGNISFDPLFVDTVNDDYHLLPESPCIDAGNPASDYSLEPMPNGGRVDMGVYGNTPQATLSRNVLTSLGFQIISKSRTGRTLFEYELAVIVRNPNAYDMTDIQMKLRGWDASVVSVGDDIITIDSIPAGATVTSTDTFRIVVDRSMLIVPGMLTWDLIYYVPGEQVQQAQMSMLLSEIDAGAPGDISGDGEVNFDDFAILAGQWNTVPGTPSADIALPLDGYVGIEDLIYLAENWLN